MHSRNFLIAYTLWVIILFLLVLCATGCTKTVRSVEYNTDTLTVIHERTDTVVVNSFKTDTVHEYTHNIDSVYVRDSVFVMQRSDTVYYYKEKWNNAVTIKHDTVYKHHTDTLVVYQNTQEADTVNHSIDNKKVVVKEKKTWNWLSWLGLTCIAGCLTFIGILAYKYYKGK